MLWLIELFLRQRECGIRRGNARVHGHVEEHLRDVVRIDPDSAAGAQVQRQFFTAQRRQDRNRDQASRPPVQVRSGPEGTPGRLCDEALEVGIELGGAGLRLLDVLTSEYLLADLHSSVEA